MCQSELVLMNVANGGFCIIVWLVVVWICCMWLVSPICVLDCDCVMYVLLCVNGVLFVVGVCCWWKTTLAMLVLSCQCCIVCVGSGVTTLNIYNVWFGLV